MERGCSADWWIVVVVTGGGKRWWDVEVIISGKYKLLRLVVYNGGQGRWVGVVV